MHKFKNSLLFSSLLFSLSPSQANKTRTTNKVCVQLFFDLALYYNYTRKKRKKKTIKNAHSQSSTNLTNRKIGEKKATREMKQDAYLLETIMNTASTAPLSLYCASPSHMRL